MSLIVLAIAILPACGVAIVAAYTNSRTATAIAALAAALLGIFTGSPIYMALDLVAVVAFAWFSWPELPPEVVQSNAAKKASKEAYYASQKYKDDIAKIDTYMKSIVAAGVIIYLAWLLLPSSAQSHKEITYPEPAANAYSSTITGTSQSTSFARCKGNPDIKKCEELELKLLNESSADRAARQSNLNNSYKIQEGQPSNVNAYTRNSTRESQNSPPQHRPSTPNITDCIEIENESKMLSCLEKAR